MKLPTGREKKLKYLIRLNLILDETDKKIKGANRTLKLIIDALATSDEFQILGEGSEGRLKISSLRYYDVLMYDCIQLIAHNYKRLVFIV